MKDKIIKLIAVGFPLLIWFVPSVGGLSFDAMFVGVLFIIALLLWVTQGIDWPSLYVIGMLLFVPQLNATTVFAQSFGNPTFVFLMFTFVLTYALTQTHFIKRIAIWFVSLKFSSRSLKHLTFSFLSSALLIGFFMSPTVLFFVLFPILEEIYHVLGLKKGDRLAEMMIMGLVLTTSLSSGMTPIAHVFPILAMGTFTSLTGTFISHTSYMMFAIPFGLLIFGSMFLLMFGLYRKELKVFTMPESIDLKVDKNDLREKVIVSIFFIVVSMWIFPELLKDLFPIAMGYIKQLGIAGPPLLGVIVLSMIKIDHKALINLNEAFTKGVSWPSLLMTAAALALGSALTHPEIGLVTSITENMAPLIQNLPNILLIFVFVVWASLQSNISSHMVTAQLVSSIAVPIFLASTSLNAGAMAALIGLLASLGSATPPSMPYVAMVGASNWTTTKNLMNFGFIMMFIVIALSVTVGYQWATLFIG